MNVQTWCGAAVVALCLWAGAAVAQGAAGGGENTESDRPWAQGVSEENRRAALELFRQGNALLKDSLFVQAAAKYREALAAWDHPAIHYNMVLALLNLDQPVEVREHLVKAMRFGAAPLDADKFEQAKAYLRLVEGQLARVVITCDVPGANVVMDGRPLFTAPGRYEGWVRAGPHTVVATNEGYLTNEMSPSLPAGRTTTMTLQLFKQEDLTRYRRRFATWVPWTVLGAGVALAAAGGAMHLNARDDFRAYDAGITDCGGCVPSEALRSRLLRGQSMQTLAVGGYALGGAALAAGVTLVLLNQPQPYRVSPDELNEGAISFAPVFAPGTGGATALVRF